MRGLGTTLILATALLSCAVDAWPSMGRRPAAANNQPRSGLYPGADRLLSKRHDDWGSWVDYNAVKADLAKLLTDSKDFWPADEGNYGGLFIRLAWHCSGSYRESDGRGGCDGGRIRFNPERSWPDNTNLDKALLLLEPIKLKYPGLSWGDLIVLAGNVAISANGGPILGFCAGRDQDANGDASVPLGPSDAANKITNCTLNGNCTFPLGPTTMGLIYVNPEGHLADGDPVGVIADIRASFGRMGMNDRETVALIGGGHEFGKTHGACPTGAGPSPLEDPVHPWPGTCGNGTMKGKGVNTFTSGFELSWTTTPSKWSNEYFRNLLCFDWRLVVGPGGHKQFAPMAKPGGPVPDSDIGMLVADIALLKDPSYLALVKEYAADIKSLENDFAHAWYKLTTHDMGPHWRCKGGDVPVPQEFQMPLPDTQTWFTDFESVEVKVRDAVGINTENVALLSTLAWQCASTFRLTDHSGGCNGARIRLSPEKELPANKGLDAVISSTLGPIKDSFPGISYADLIVLAGTVALSEATGCDAFTQGFRGGRVDLTAPQSEAAKLAPRDYIPGTIAWVRDNWAVRGLSVKHGVALAGIPRSAARQKSLGYSGAYTDKAGKLDNTFYRVLLLETWDVSPQGVTGPQRREYVSTRTSGLYVTEADVVLLWDEEARAVVEEFASNNELFVKTLAEAWSLFMAADLPPQ